MRLTVLGGYLGSGKTSWLRHQLHAGLYEDAFILVNEAAETPVDDVLLQRASRMAVLAGGCACCTAKGELIRMLRAVCDERSRTGSGEGRFEQIVMETSGLADPGPIVAAIQTDPVLVNHIVIHEIVVAVDGLNALAQLRAEPLGRRQIETADRLVVTKIDAAQASALATLGATLRLLNPGASISGAVQGQEGALPEFAEARPDVLPDLPEADPAPIFPTRLALGEDIDWTAFSVWLSALLHARGDDVVRVKGVVRTPAGRLLLQSVRRIVQSPEMLPEPSEQDEAREDDMIVVIGRGYRAEDLRRSLAHFAGLRG